MELAKIEVTRADARKVHCDTLTAGMKGAEVTFSFDASWDGLKRLATFKAGGVSKDMLLTEDRCEIPHEVLAKPCPRLVVGIVGTTADGCLVIPTVWAELGRVEQGAKPSGDSSKKPTPEVWAQILGMIGDLDDLNTDEKETLVAAINEVLLKGADPEEIQKIVEEYLGENGSGGIHVGPYPPDDPNVDIWIDTSEKLTPPYIPNTTAKPGQIVRVVAVDGNGMVTAVEAVDMPGGHELPAATADTLGGIKAEPATEDDTQPVRIGEDGMLFTAPGGGGEKWEKITDVTVEMDLESIQITEDQNGKPFSLKKVFILIEAHPALQEGSSQTLIGLNFTTAHAWSASFARFRGPANENEWGLRQLVVSVAEDGLLIPINALTSYNDTNMRTQLLGLKDDKNFIDYTTATAGRTYVSTETWIDIIHLGSYTQGLGKGTRLIVYGVRA